LHSRRVRTGKGRRLKFTAVYRKVVGEQLQLVEEPGHRLVLECGHIAKSGTPVQRGEQYECPKC